MAGKQRRLRKRHLKSEFMLLQTLSHLFHPFNSSNVGNFLGVELWRTVSKFRKEKESCYLVILSSTKREIKHFHAVVVQWRLKNVQKSVMHVQSCCFVNLNLLLCCRSRCLRRRCCLTFLMTNKCTKMRDARAKSLSLLLKVMLHETIRNDDF